MLDQNTDRMWYVIGAVIVGTAIIFLLNSSFPQVFASVGDTFKQKTTEVSKVVDRTSPMAGITDGINRIPYGEKQLMGGETWSTDAIENQRPFSVGWKPEFMRHADIAPILDKYGYDQTYTLTLDMKSMDTSNNDTVRIYLQNGSDSRHRFIYDVVKATESFQTYRITGLRPSMNGGSKATASHLAFYGIYDTGNQPVVKNVKLERERISKN